MGTVDLFSLPRDEQCKIMKSLCKDSENWSAPILFKNLSDLHKSLVIAILDISAKKTWVIKFGEENKNSLTIVEWEWSTIQDSYISLSIWVCDGYWEPLVL